MLSLVPSECDLEYLIASYEGGQAGQGLFARPAHTYQQGVTPWGAYDAGDLDQVGHGIFEEDQIYGCTSHCVIITHHVLLELLLQKVKTGNLQYRADNV